MTGGRELPGLGGTTADGLLSRFEPLVPPVSTAGAAVTLVLRDGARGPEVLLIVRTTRATDRASGQVALPGGQVDDVDGSLAATAARELAEEVGLGVTDLAGPLRFVGSQLARRFGLRVGIFASALGPRSREPRPTSLDEVAHVYWLPLAELETTRRVHVEAAEGLLEVPATVYGGHVLWGFTRRVLREFVGLAAEDPLEGPALRDRPVPASDEPPG